VLNSAIQTIWEKTETKLLVFLNKMDNELSDYESLNEVKLVKCCKNAQATKKVRMY
jgi:hypothetical protein